MGDVRVCNIRYKEINLRDEELEVKLTKNMPICPICKKSTERISKAGYSTEIYCPRRYDVEGNLVSRDMNTITENFECCECNSSYSVSYTAFEGIRKSRYGKSVIREIKEEIAESRVKEDETLVKELKELIPSLSVLRSDQIGSYKDMPSFGEWVPVERAYPAEPDKGKADAYLVTDENGYVFISFFLNKEMREEAGGVCWYGPTRKVVAWTPMPKPYVGEE